MMTAARYSISWSDKINNVRHTLFHSKAAPCIANAKIVSHFDAFFDVEVREVDTGKELDWRN